LLRKTLTGFEKTLTGFETLSELKIINMVPLENGKYYHIYNRGNNREDLFRSKENYEYFLRLYEKYIYPIADTYAWVLMKNHFHLLVRIKEEEEVGLNELPNPVRVLNPDRVKIKSPHLYFSHLFNSYTQAYNKMYERTGTLFQRPFQRIEVTSDRYFRQIVVYIHTNPVHHKFCSDYTYYPWSSYDAIISNKRTKLNHEQTLEWFNDRENLIEVHQQKPDYDLLNDLTLE
jgi:putative transposase